MIQAGLRWLSETLLLLDFYIVGRSTRDVNHIFPHLRLRSFFAVVLTDYIILNLELPLAHFVSFKSSLHLVLSLFLLDLLLLQVFLDDLVNIFGCPILSPSALRSLALIFERLDHDGLANSSPSHGPGLRLGKSQAWLPLHKVLHVSHAKAIALLSFA